MSEPIPISVKMMNLGPDNRQEFIAEPVLTLANQKGLDKFKCVVSRSVLYRRRKKKNPPGHNMCHDTLLLNNFMSGLKMADICL